MSSTIQTAILDWQCVDGIDIPVSRQFGDVYFSKDNGLLETRHVFLNGNNLTERLADLKPYQYFCVGETGFGTGLNILAVWQLWQQVRPDNQSHLHVISVEKFPLSKSDLERALRAWPELTILAEQLIEQYPFPIAGCHRLNFPDERFSLDLWLGDAHDVFPSIVKTHSVNAWFLDGFAPACNPELWEAQVLNQIVRLSDYGTTFASFSVAGILKRGLKAHGIHISRPRGFGHKREMLKAIWPFPEHEFTPTVKVNQPSIQQHFAVIGAGIAGLHCAWSLAQRGHRVTLVDQSLPLSGASGNPLALLNPKLCPITQCNDHLMVVCWQYARRFYQNFDAFRPIQVNQIALKASDSLLNLAEQYPKDVLDAHSAQQSSLETQYDYLTLHHAGVISPQLFCNQVLQHPLIEFKQFKVNQILEIDGTVQLLSSEQAILESNAAIVCCARESGKLFEQYPTLKPIRGQVSWFDQDSFPFAPDQAFSYGGYCMQLHSQQLILGASFHPQRDDDEVLLEDHVHNFNLIHSVFPAYAQTLPPVEAWHGRASVRAQSPDYFPLVGQLKDHSKLFTLAGLGSKGYLFAPLSSEILVAHILGEACPVSANLLQKLNPQRFLKKVKTKKPYYSS